ISRFTSLISIIFFYFEEEVEGYKTKKSLSKSNHWNSKKYLINFFKFILILYSNFLPFLCESPINIFLILLKLCNFFKLNRIIQKTKLFLVPFTQQWKRKRK